MVRELTDWITDDAGLGPSGCVEIRDLRQFTPIHATGLVSAGLFCHLHRSFAQVVCKALTGLCQHCLANRGAPSTNQDM